MRKDGLHFPVLVMEAPLISATGRQTGWMSAVIDLTEQRKAEALSRATQERLQASARLASVGEMASMLSHELNQPLVAIASYANGSMHMLQTRRHNETADELRHLLAEVQVAMQRIAEQSARAGRIINTVRDFVARRSQSREAVTPRALYEAISSLALIQARSLGARLVANVPAHLPAVLCNRTMVEQVLLNLTRNAMQAMEGMTPVGTCTVTASYVPPASPVDEVGPATGRGWVEFCVADEGPGIPPEVAEKLFTPFFTTKPEGMGIGLGLCRTVLEQHGSELVHRPNTPRGTVFSFRMIVV
jgi:two-component system sensor histidine kinase DctS